MTKGYLMLQTGEVFSGDWIGAKQDTTGELVFNTSMTGYQEMMTDPSYTGQILTFCYPMIGNYGINLHDLESSDIAVSAVIMSDVCEEPSHYQSVATMSEKLAQAGVSGLTNIDTRALVAIIRKHQTVRARIVSQQSSTTSMSSWKQESTIELVRTVTVPEYEVVGMGDIHIVLLDFGYKKSIVDELLAAQCKVTIVPFTTSVEEIALLTPDGILISNGPGDPIELAAYFSTVKLLSERYPTLGICLGHQLLALAYGGKTKKMPYGHRGGNHPVKELTTGKVIITSQNHGYEVVEESINKETFELTFHNVNDNSVEGIKHRSLPIQSVQFHPEAHPGPSDAAYIFQSFFQQVKTRREQACQSVHS
ncbi:carbamoyl-phosphate synthase arginine-specific small chain [Oceanobacillus picturae]|uniref:Carbamoyl phosphate synthase small chain n=1 Tax=Oceanobacillus picturae TaxID=171693 RepID=A0A0U9H904_9BACI|nr:carbamoyl phosphate synthase small subunit [Oceanobacillus picturae]GAQ18991.1 carbamoyl-phosphate synthase arginine-specific small chain [Oceanobacillus picturae]